MTLTERVRLVMEAEDMSAARFADFLEIGRAVISHILNERNKPSLDVVTRIIEKIPRVNPEWLLTDKGDMYRSSSEEELNEASNIDNKKIAPDLFSQVNTDNNSQKQLSENVKIAEDNRTVGIFAIDEEVSNSNSDLQQTIKERIIYKEAPVKKIKQIIIYYSDNTFETFISD